MFSVGYGATSVVYKANKEVKRGDGQPEKHKVAIKRVKNVFDSN